jgi:hypothetical protein
VLVGFGSPYYPTKSPGTRLQHILVEGYRGRGYAFEAALAVVKWAAAQANVRSVTRSKQVRLVREICTLGAMWRGLETGSRLGF